MQLNAHCTACKAWVLRRCSGIRGALSRVKDYTYGRCKGLHDDDREVTLVKLGNDMIKESKIFATWKQWQCSKFSYG